MDIIIFIRVHKVKEMELAHILLGGSMKKKIYLRMVKNVEKMLICGKVKLKRFGIC